MLRSYALIKGTWQTKSSGLGRIFVNIGFMGDGVCPSHATVLKSWHPVHQSAYKRTTLFLKWQILFVVAQAVSKATYEIHRRGRGERSSEELSFLNRARYYPTSQDSKNISRRQSFRFSLPLPTLPSLHKPTATWQFISRLTPITIDKRKTFREQWVCGISPILWTIVWLMALHLFLLW